LFSVRFYTHFYPLLSTVSTGIRVMGSIPSVFGYDFDASTGRSCAHHVYAWMRVCVCVRAPVRVSVRVSVRVVVWCAPECTRGVPEGRLSVIV